MKLMDNQADPKKLDPMPEYNSQSVFTIAFKNFTAGFSRALGGVMVYGIFLVLMYFVYQRYLYPQLQPHLELFTDLGRMQLERAQENPDLNQQLLDLLQTAE